MSTVSTIPAVKAQLVTKFATATATASSASGQIDVSYAWPGPDCDPEAIFLGVHPDLERNVTEAAHDIPTIKAGRKQRQESYTVPVTIWNWRPEFTPADAASCESEAFTVFGLLEGVLADDPTIGLSSIQWARLGDFESLLRPYGKGWVCALRFDVNVEARLT